MPDPDRFVTRLRRRLFLGEMLHVAAGLLAVFLVGFGGALLAAKLFAPRALPAVYWSSLGVVPVLAWAAWRALRRTPSGREVTAMLDSRAGAGGLLMTLSERPDPRWRRLLPPADVWAAALPRLRPARFAKTVAVPALFAAGAGFVPPREEPPPPPQVAAGADAVRELAETFELLDGAAALDRETGAGLRQELDELAAEAAEEPLTHEKWETVDALRERMRSGLEAAALTVSKGRSAAAVLGAASAAASPLAGEREEQLSETLADAVEMLRKNGAFARGTTGVLSEMPAEVQRLLRSGEFRLPADPAARREALEQLASLLEGEQRRLAGARGRAASVLGDLLSPDALFDHLGAELGGAAGLGSEGTALAFGDEAEVQAAKFKETILPPGFLDSPNDETAGVTASAPRADPSGAAPRNTARGSGTSTGGATWDRPLRPRHRDAVRRYFDDG